ncbi:MAG: vWA domain-containing protein [Streptosporangiaceae bacterium]
MTGRSMLTAIDGMITELRQIGVPVSLTEKLDAVRSLRHLPLADREGLKAALRAALVKSHDHELAFDTLFDLYFSPSAGPVAGPVPPGRDGPAGTGQGSFGSLDDAGLTELLLAALRDGNEVMLRLIAGIFVERHAAIEPGRPVAGTYYVFRTLRAVDPDRLIARLVAAGQEAGQEAGAQSALLRRLQAEGYEAQMQRFRQAVEAQVRLRLVADRGAAAVARTLRRPLPEDAEFLNSSHEQIIAMRGVLDPLTRRLAGRLAAKRRHRRRGALDFRRTIRESLSTGGVPVDPVFRKPRPAKPELFVLADISGSVSTFAAFTLQLMFALRVQFSRVRSFVFVDGIDEVTEILQQAPDVIDATRNINALGSGVWLNGRSDYGHALESFWQHWGEQVRRRTTVIVLGDARSNYLDPREGVLKAVRERAAHLFWLNPEPRTAWNTGDSVIGRYQPFCDAVHECRNLRQLRRFAEELD